MPLPNFLIIGAMKAGTTSLYRYLSQHPQIYMSPVKEPRFFAPESHPASQTGDRPGKSSFVGDLATYQALFDGVTTETAIGEASPIYIYSPNAPERIQHLLPEVKLIAVLRHPAERAFSHYLHVWQSGREPLNTFAEAIATEDQRIQANWSSLWHYRQRGLYYQQLQRYFERFDAAQIKIYLNEDLRNDTPATLKSIYQFLAVDDSVELDASTKHNTAKKTPKNAWLHQFLTQKNPIKSALKPFLPTQLRQRVRDRAIASNLATPQLLPEMRQQLTDWYRDDILQLQDLIKRDLTHWLSADEAPARPTSPQSQSHHPHEVSRA